MGSCISLSVIYGYFFVLVSNLPENELFSEKKLLFGFCVWGSPEEPSEESGCENSPTNSHKIAFIIDMVMTCLVGVFYFKHNDKAIRRGNYLLTYIASGFIIFAHGFLHWFLQQTNVKEIFGLDITVDCYNKDLVSGDNNLTKYGFIIFGGFSFTLGLIILSFGFGGLKNLTTNIIYSAIFASIVVNVIRRQVDN